MPVMTLELPDALRAYAEEQVAIGGYRDVGEFVRDLLEADQIDRHRNKIEASLLEAVDGPFTSWTPDDLDEVRRRAADAVDKSPK